MRKVDRLATAGYVALCLSGLLVVAPATASQRTSSCSGCGGNAGLWIMFGALLAAVALFGILCVWLLAGLAKPMTLDSAAAVVVITLCSIACLLVSATPALFIPSPMAKIYGILCFANAGLFLPLLNLAQELDQPPVRDPRSQDDDAPGYSSVM